jgi:hypothetical protein
MFVYWMLARLARFHQTQLLDVNEEQLEWRSLSQGGYRETWDTVLARNKRLPANLR